MHHCRKCDVCVARFDHHCDWIGNCVGAQNRKLFFSFLVLATVTDVVAAAALGVRAADAALHGPRWSPLLYASAAVFVGAAVPLARLLAFHARAAAHDTTTYEYIVNASWDLPNPYFRGVAASLRGFFLRSTPPMPAVPRP